MIMGHCPHNVISEYDCAHGLWPHNTSSRSMTVLMGFWPHNVTREYDCSWGFGLIICHQGA